MAKQQPSYTPVNYISDEELALLKAYENVAMCRADVSASGYVADEQHTYVWPRTDRGQFDTAEEILQNVLAIFNHLDA